MDTDGDWTRYAVCRGVAVLREPSGKNTLSEESLCGLFGCASGSSGTLRERFGLAGVDEQMSERLSEDVSECIP